MRSEEREERCSKEREERRQRQLGTRSEERLERRERQLDAGERRLGSEARWGRQGMEDAWTPT